MSPLLIALVVVIVLVVALLAIGLPLLDRYAAALAERKAGEYLSVPFGRPATVRVIGRPFLTQALRGVFGNVSVSGGGLRIGEMSGATLDAQLRNVYVPLRDLRRRRTREIACEHLEGRLVLPYGELARVAKVPGLELRPSRDRVVATAALPVPGISQLARVSGRAVLTLGEGNTVWLRVRGVSVAGINLPSVVLNQLLPALDVPIPLPQLPYGLRIDEVQPAADGLIVMGSAAAVVFRPLESADAADAGALDAVALEVDRPDGVESARDAAGAPSREAARARPRPTRRDSDPDH